MTNDRHPDAIDPHGVGQKCQAMSRRHPGRPCHNYALKGMNVCRFHGGSIAKHGVENHATRSGRYSKHFPTEIMPGYEASKTDPDLLSMKQELHALDGIIAAREARLGTGANGAFLTACRRLVLQIQTYQRAGDLDEMGESLTALMELVLKGGKEEDGQAELVKLYEQRARLAKAEMDRMVALGSMMTMEQALILMRTWDDMLRRYVRDPADLRAIDMELEAILDGVPERVHLIRSAGGG